MLQLLLKLLHKGLRVQECIYHFGLTTSRQCFTVRVYDRLSNRLGKTKLSEDTKIKYYYILSS